jgi:hypothetical protein
MNINAIVNDLAVAMQDERAATARQSVLMRKLFDMRDEGLITQSEMQDYIHDAFCVAEGVAATCSVIRLEVTDTASHAVA